MRKKIALTVGCFDLLHRGHLNVFREMSNLADELLIGIHDDESIFINKKIHVSEPFPLRMKNVSDLGHRVFPVTAPDPSEALEKVIGEGISQGYDFIYLRGDDWERFPGRDVIERYSIPIVIIPYTKGVSSTLLREKGGKFTA